MTAINELSRTPSPPHGYAMPAEWDPHAATWIGWPHNRGDWPGKIIPIRWVYGEIVRAISPTETVRILVQSAAHEALARRTLRLVGVDAAMVEFFRIPTNRGWTRDFGPIFVRQHTTRSNLAILRFQFNAWAKYPDWNLDCQVAERVATTLDRPLIRVDHSGSPVVLEGGAIDVNGAGVVMTTEECLLDRETQARNPTLSRDDMEAILGHYFGCSAVLWLARGIVGDDTHGHVDDVCRFVSPRQVVLCQEVDARDDNHRLLEENRELIEGFRLADGSRLEIVRLPMPAPLYFDGQRVPASYANFYITNGAVLVPTFNDPNDRVAVGILADLFPGRRVVGIHSVDLIWGLGAIHCLTQQEPRI